MKAAESHLSCGVMAALAKLKVQGKTISEYHHLGECTSCAHNFDGVIAQMNTPSTELNVKVSQFFEGMNCVETDDTFDKATSVFVPFLNADLPEEISLKLFAHLNQCYFCFEMFARNWSDYLKTSEKIKGES